MYVGERVIVRKREYVREMCERDTVCSGRYVNERESVLGKERVCMSD